MVKVSFADVELAYAKIRAQHLFSESAHLLTSPHPQKINSRKIPSSSNRIMLAQEYERADIFTALFGEASWEVSPSICGSLRSIRPKNCEALS
jgi:hypothetical protein